MIEKTNNSISIIIPVVAIGGDHLLFKKSSCNMLMANKSQLIIYLQVFVAIDNYNKVLHGWYLHNLDSIRFDSSSLKHKNCF